MNKQRRNCLFRNNIVLLIIQLTSWLNGQNIGNYVSNGSFEDTINIQNFIYYPRYWGALDSGKYFGALLRAPNEVPKNSFGFQEARSGKNIFGISPYSTYVSNNRGYPKNRLKQTLLVNHLYCVTIYVALTNQSTHGIDALGAYFGNTDLDTISKCNDPIVYLVPQITNLAQNVITDTLNWTAITGTFVANGTEKYMLIGNFKSNANTNATLTNTVNLPATFSEYYLDDVSVIDIDLPAYAGPDKRCLPGDSVFIGREPDVGIDEVCTWYKLPNMSTPIATVAGLYVKPVTTTTYVVRQQLWCSSVKYDTVVVYEDALGIVELGMLKDELRVSPNPANDALLLSLAKGSLSQYFQTVEILDAQGRVLKVVAINEKDVELKIYTNNLESGIYFLRLSNNDEQYRINKKLMVRH